FAEQLRAGVERAIGRATDAGFRARGEQRLQRGLGQWLDAAERYSRERDLREVLDELEAQQRRLAVLAPRDHAVIAEQHGVDELAPRRERGARGLAGLRVRQLRDLRA